ncbi:MAG: carbonic anhydrase [Gammaproteobacteria bacterium]
MNQLKHLLDNNQKWAEGVTAADPDFFRRLAAQQKPEYLWIGCSDSRVPASRVVDLMPGEVFVHRNIANLVQNGDANCQSVIQYAVEALQVKHIIICGHYACGGVLASMKQQAGGLMDDWLQSIKRTQHKHEQWLNYVAAEKQGDVLCELNVIEQAMSLSQNEIIQRAWLTGQEIHLHAWIYNLQDGRIRDLGFGCGSDDSAGALYTKVINGIKHGRV